MTTAMQTPQRRSRSKLQDVSLVNGPMLLLKSIRGFSSNRSLMWLATVPLALFGLGIFNLSAHAADLPELNAAFLANNLWLLIATILVIFMNAGFAMVEAGMCRSKNAVNILAKNLFVFALAVTAYWTVGYSIMYGGSLAGGWLYFNGLFFDPTVTAETVADGGLVPTVDFLFQSAFAGTAATIVSGLVAERVKFGEFVVFALVLTAVIYPISGSWQWNGGWLSELGFVDFAGSSIVHSVGAWAGLVGAMLLGPRIGKFVSGKPQAMPGHNMAIATLGALVLWIGWYGFNPGSQLAMDEWVPYVAVTTTLAAAGGAIGATLISTMTSGKPDLTMIINGILAGLVSITAGCANLTLVGSWLAGLVGGVIVVFSVSALDAAEIDDPVGAFSVHGVCGVWGTLVVGIWGYDIQGSQLAMDQWVPYVAVTTTLAAAGGAIGATVISTMTSGKPDLTMIINGILAGLVSITAGCANLTLVGSWLAGLVGGVIVVFSVSALDAAEIDDPVGAFSVHGVCGVWGTLVVGIWGYDIQGDGSPLGFLVGAGFNQFFIQALGCAAYAIWTLVTCWIAWSVIGGLFGGIRVSEKEEIQGLDIGEHGMEAYPDFASSK